MEGDPPMFEILVGIALIVFASKVGPAVAHRLGHGVDRDVRRQLDDLESRVATTEDRMLDLSAGTHERFVEVEERLDVAERVLQAERQRDRLPRGE